MRSTEFDKKVWRALKLIPHGRVTTYKEIAKKTGGSTTTITRVAHWLDHGLGGYQAVLTRLFSSRKRSL